MVSERQEHEGEHRWQALHPALPSSTHYRCCIVVDEYTDKYGNSREILCSASKTVETSRCDCTHPQPLPFFRRGICQRCDCIIPGCEDEADSDPDNY